MPRLQPVAIGFVAASLGASSLCVARQCGPEWGPGEGVSGVEWNVNSTILWDPDGPGPLESVVAVGGRFRVAGNVMASNIAAWNGESFAPVGPGLADEVSALATLPDGRLVAAHEFNGSRVRVWNGAAWTEIGRVNGGVRAMTAQPDGQLVIAGDFTTIDGAAFNRIARWDGASWSSFGSGMENYVAALLVLPNGDLIAGGHFLTAGGVFTNHIARWNGVAWSGFGSGMSTANPDSVNALARLDNGNIVAAGDFTTAGGVPAENIAVWNGVAWGPLGAGTDNIVHALTVLPGGDLIVGGGFRNAGGVPARSIARWSGGAWSSLQDTDGGVASLVTLPSGGFIAGGDFRRVGGDVGARSIARWEGGAWSALAPGMNERVYDIAVHPNGDRIAVGWFTRAGDATAFNVARRTGNGWEPIGAGVGDGVFTGSGVSTVAILHNGDIVVGGFFQTAGETPVSNIARWDGAQWRALGAGVTGAVQDLLVLGNGDLVAAGSIASAGGLPVRSIARWDGASWHPLGQGVGLTSNDSINSVVERLSGEIVAGGNFAQLGDGTSAANIARWDGSAWQPLGSGLAGGANQFVQSLSVTATGDVIVGGGFTTAGGVAAANIARWDGAAWHAMGPGSSNIVWSTDVRPNGDILAGGEFGAPILSNRLVRWDGAQWVSLGQFNRFIHAVESDTEAILVGGEFTAVDTTPAGFWAELADRSCPADFNCTGTADSQDIFDFLTAFFATAPSADFNDDGAVNSQDFFDFLGAFFVGC